MSIDDPLWPTAAEWLRGDAADPKLVVQGVPTSAASLTASDGWQAPAALRRLLDRFAAFDSETGTDLSSLAVADRGDWPLATLNPTAAFEHVAAAARDLPVGPVYVFVGGDNMITHPLLANLPHAPLRRWGLITFDAHHDVRVPPPDRPSNGSPIRMLVEGGFPASQVVQIGIHGFANSGQYRAWCDEQGIRIATMPMVEEHGIVRIVDEALAYLDGSVDAIYVDCDLDVLDRIHAPACPGSRPGGLTPRQLAAAVGRVARHPKVVAMDLVEVDPTRDVAETTMMTLASLLLTFAAGVASRSG